MTVLRRYWLRMGGFLAGVAIILGFLADPISRAFLSNAVLNGVIVAVLGIGIVFIFRQTARLGPEIDWIDEQRSQTREEETAPAPQLLAPIRRLIGQSQERAMLSPLAMRSLLDGIAARLDESREVSRYLIGLLIFLGLLGTFWGLLQTIQAVGDVVGGLEIGGSDPSASFERLKQGLEAPLASMGTAFSSSLFGLAGSLVLGFLDIQLGQAQNRFYTELEDWLSQTAHLERAPRGAAEDGPAADGGAPYSQALLEQIADGIDALRRSAQPEDGRRSLQQSLSRIADQQADLLAEIRRHSVSVSQLASAQSELKELLSKLSFAIETGRLGIDSQSQEHLRNSDVWLSQILEQLARSENDDSAELRREIRLLARTIAAAIGQPEENAKAAGSEDPR